MKKRTVYVKREHTPLQDEVDERMEKARRRSRQLEKRELVRLNKKMRRGKKK